METYLTTKLRLQSTFLTALLGLQQVTEYGLFNLLMDQDPVRIYLERTQLPGVLTSVQNGEGQTD